MSDLLFNMTEVDGHKSLTVFDATGYSKVVDQGHPYWAAILQALVEEPQDFDKIAGLIDPELGIRKAVQEVNPRLTVDRNGVYLDGIRVQGGAARLVKDRLFSGDSDWARYARFLVNLSENPSKRAQDFLFGWVEQHGATITEEGHILGYKGLTLGTDPVTGEEHVPVSAHSGPNNFIDGVLYGQSDVAYQVPHRLGTVVSKRRGDVDDSRQACGTGLHVGAYNYALTFGENREASRRGGVNAMGTSTFALVKFNPRDVVGGEGDWKIRVCAYEIAEFLEEAEPVLEDQTSYDTPEVEDVTVEETNVAEVAGIVTQVEEPLYDSTGAVLKRPNKGTTLDDYAKVNTGLRKDLRDRRLGHKPLAAKYAAITSEASVRRYRKANDITLTTTGPVWTTEIVEQAMLFERLERPGRPGLLTKVKG